MLKRTIFRIFPPASAFTLLSLLAIYSAEAQDPPPQPKQTQQQKDSMDKNGARRQGAQIDDPGAPGRVQITIPTYLVRLDVTVVDQNNNPVSNLKKEDFSVYEDNVKQTIDHVNREEAPVSFGMVIDTSGSMRTKLQTVSDAALLLVRQMWRDDEAFVAPFGEGAELGQDFTSDRYELEEAIGRLSAGGGTALLDAIIATADYAQEKGKRPRKALIVISDGLEKNSSVKEKEVMEAIREDEVQVHLIGIIDEEMEERSLFGKSPAKRAKELLTRIANDSGGRAYFPKGIGEIPAIAAQIAKDLRSQYVVTYYPSNEKRDGSFRAIKVVVNPVGGRKISAHTRLGYYARNADGVLPEAHKGSRDN
jgi:Ca-activated chloride channel homolog